MVAITCAVVVTQLRELVTDVVKEGIPALERTCVVDDAVHPFAGFVTVNVYTLAEAAVAVYELAPLVTPPVQTGVQVVGLAEPINVTVGVAQVIVCVPDTVTVGVVVFCVMV